MLARILPWARVSLLALPLFGLISATELGCEAKTAEDIGSQDLASRRGYGYGGYGYGGYDDGYGYDGYGYP